MQAEAAGEPGIVIRPFEPDDAAAAARIFYGAVHEGASRYYEPEQLKAWASAVPDPDVWGERLASQMTFMAERGDEVVGYMTLNDAGYIDLAFVAPDAIGQGIATRIYEALEARAQALGIDRLTTQASLAARSFFERQGWHVVTEQTVRPCGVAMTNFLMEKDLD